MNHSSKFSRVPLNLDKSRPFDALILIFSSILAIIITILILKDSILGVSKTRISNTKVIGIVENSKYKVLFRPNDDPVWNQADGKQELRPRDLIFTDVNSSAKISLESDSEIELGEKTLLSLDFEDDKPLIKLMNGEIKIRNNSGSKIKLKIGKLSPFTIDDSSVVFLQKNAEHETNIKVSKGNIFRDDVLIIEGQIAGFDQKGSLTNVQVMSLDLEKPLHQSEFLLNAGKKVWIDFEWYAQKSMNFTFQISRDLKFENLIVSKNLTAQKISIDLPIGTYFWRVQFQDSLSRRSSEVRSLIVRQQKDQVRPLKNLDENILRPPKIPRELRLEKYQGNRTNSLKIYRHNILGLLLSIFFSEGSIFAAPSNSSNVVGSKSSIIKIADEDTGKGGFESNSFKQENGSFITWESIEGASGYHVEIAEDQNFLKVIKKFFVKSSTIELSSLNIGRYYLRIATVNRSGTKGDFSDFSILDIVHSKLRKTSNKVKSAAKTTDSWSIPNETGSNEALQLQYPLDDAHFEMVGDSEFVSLAWVEAEKAKCRKYIIEVKSQVSMPQKVSKYLKANFHNWKVLLSSGVYLWRVRSDPDIRASECPGWSTPRMFSIRKKLPSIIRLLPTSERLATQFSLVRYRPSTVITAFLAPGTYLYQSQSLDPGVKVKARFINHLGIEILLPGAEHNDKEVNYGGIIKMRRLSAVLFNQQSERKVENQEPISFQLYEYELGFRLEKGFNNLNSRGILMQMDASLLAKEQGIFTWNELNSLYLVKETAYYPKIRGEFGIGIGKRSSLFAASFYGLSRKGLGNQGFFRSHGIDLGLMFDSGQNSLITQIKLGINWEVSQGSFQAHQKAGSEASFLGFKTSRNMFFLALSTGI